MYVKCQKSTSLNGRMDFLVTVIELLSTMYMTVLRIITPSFLYYYVLVKNSLLEFRVVMLNTISYISMQFLSQICNTYLNMQYYSRE